MPKQPTITPPIPDSNHNGILDGTDVLKQMKAEEINGDERDSRERAHGVFESLATRAYTDEVNAITISGRALRPDAFALIAADMNKKIEYQVTTTRAQMDKDPDFYKHTQEAMQALSRSHALTQANTDLNVADDRNFNDFAKTFSATFPKGVKIEAKDVPEILAHFGGLVVPAPSTPAPAPRQKR